MPLHQYLLTTFLLPEPFNSWLPEDSHRADFICPTAFGRNTYSDKEVGKIVRTKRNELGDDIATFEWLKSQGFDSGYPNALIADMCFDLSDTLDKPIIGQWEVMCEIYLHHSGWYENRKDQLIAIWPPKKGRLGTRELLLKAKRIADGRRRKTPVLVAHPEHLPRCYFLGRNIFDTNPATSIDARQQDWFDPKSVQWWTRGAWRWSFYELFLARPHHLFHSWM